MHSRGNRSPGKAPMGGLPSQNHDKACLQRPVTRAPALGGPQPAGLGSGPSTSQGPGQSSWTPKARPSCLQPSSDITQKRVVVRGQNQPGPGSQKTHVWVCVLLLLTGEPALDSSGEGLDPSQSPCRQTRPLTALCISQGPLGSRDSKGGCPEDDTGGRPRPHAGRPQQVGGLGGNIADHIKEFY